MEKYIELNTFLKVTGLATTGGQAKLLIRSGAITVDGIIETRNRRKLLAGMKVKYLGKSYEVISEQVR